MKKTTKKTGTAPQITSLDVVSALFTGHHDKVFSTLIPLAHAELPAMLATGFDSDSVCAAAKRIAVARQPLVGEALRLVAALRETDAMDPATNDAIGEVQWTQAEAGFALGLVTGARLAGGAR